MAQKLLLDTCTFLWMLGESERLGPRARDALLDSSRQVFLSAASSWEIAIKVRLGKLRLLGSPGALIPAQLDRNGITPLAVEHAHALATAELAAHHRDPFDRLLIAQARIERMTLVTPDAAFAPYGVETIW
ncbi:MAG: type II toxin-antitoxin system VapC family toxin [Myxococcota bacterium]